MTRLKLSFDGKIYNGTADVTGQGIDGKQHFIDVSINNVDERCTFISVSEYKLFNDGVGLCRARRSNGEAVYLTAFVKKQENKI